MANRLNDTDPQSPRAIGSKTDPGLGQAPALVASPAPPDVTPSPGSASVEELIDGSRGRALRRRPARRGVRARGLRRPCPTRRAPTSLRAAPPSRPMPPEEPSVLSPEPALYSGVGARPAHELEVPKDGESARRAARSALKVEPESTRPVVRKPAEERTVHTGRRALVRNLVAVIASSAAVAVMMMGIMRWKEAHRPHLPSEVVVLPAVAEETPVGAGAQVETASAAAPVATVSVEAVPVAPSAAAVVPEAPAAKPVGSGQKRARLRPKAAAIPAESLDDLNQQIRH